MDMTLIQGTISGLKAAGDIAKGILELKSLTDVQGKVIELQSAILSAQSSALSANADQAAMAEEIKALKLELAELVAWSTQKQRYQLIPWGEGAALVYALKESCKEAEPPHWICPSCYETGRRAILQPSSVNGFAHIVCASCKFDIPTGHRRLGPATYAQG